ncbi:MAG: CvpA family protein [Actinomycetota bacterium]
MIDIAVLVLLVALVVRGWVRGFVREAIDVGALIIGAFLAFRLAPTAGSVLHDFFGIAPDMARVIGGAILFLGISVGAGFVGALISKSIKHVPGFPALNRLGGAALGAMYTAVLVVIAVTLIAAAPLRGVAQAHVDLSTVVAYVSQPNGTAQQAMRALSGDRALQSMIWIRDTVDGWVIDLDTTDVTLPSGEVGSDAHASVAMARDLYEHINSERADAGLDLLTWSEGMSLVAAARALEAYRTGTFAEQTPLAERLDSAEVAAAGADEYLVLAPTVGGLAEAASSGDGFTDVGVGVVDGPYGLLAVVIQSS